MNTTNGYPKYYKMSLYNNLFEELLKSDANTKVFGDYEELKVGREKTTLFSSRYQMKTGYWTLREVDGSVEYAVIVSHRDIKYWGKTVFYVFVLQKGVWVFYRGKRTLREAKEVVEEVFSGEGWLLPL